MTFPIDITVPAAANDPADDQGPMQTNFQNINSFLKVDHTNPASTGAGTHLQVSFGSNNPPTFPLTYPELFTNTQDGAGNGLPNAFPELFFYTGIAGSSKNQYVSTANGSVLVMGGIIIKWGTNAITNSSQAFPVSFPNNAFSMIVSSRDAALGSPLKVTALSASAYTVTRSGSGNTAYFYIAIGN